MERWLSSGFCRQCIHMPKCIPRHTHMHITKLNNLKNEYQHSWKQYRFLNGSSGTGLDYKRLYSLDRKWAAWTELT